MNRLFALIALVLAAAGGALGLVHAPGGPVLVFVLATLAALGTRAGIVLGALALIGGLATAPGYQPTLILPALGMGLAGLGLGLLGRDLDRYARAFSPLVLGALLVVVLVSTLAIPSHEVLLAAPSGEPLGLPGVVVDGATFLRTWTAIPAQVSLANPTGSLGSIAAVAGLVAALLLTIVHLRGNAQNEASAAWQVTVLAAGLGATFALVGFGQLVIGSVDLDPDLVQRSLALAASRDGSLVELALPAAELRLWSRPWVDGLRLLPAMGLLLLALRELRRLKPTAEPIQETPTVVTDASPFTPIALALTALGTALVAAANGLHGAPLALIGGLALGLGALVAQRLSAPETSGFGPRLGLLASALVWVYAWLITPLFGA